jgi:hypothetical protein
MLGREWVNLRVGALEADVAQILCVGERAGAVDGGGGGIDAQDAAGVGGTGGLAGRLPGAAADVENVVAWLDAAGAVQGLVVAAQLGVVVDGAPLPRLALGAVRDSWSR